MSKKHTLSASGAEKVIIHTNSIFEEEIEHDSPTAGVSVAAATVAMAATVAT